MGYKAFGYSFSSDVVFIFLSYVKGIVSVCYHVHYS